MEKKNNVKLIKENIPELEIIIPNKLEFDDQKSTIEVNNKEKENDKIEYVNYKGKCVCK